MRRTSYITSLSKEKFAEIIAESISFSDALRKLGLSTDGSNHKPLKKRIIEDGVDIFHFGPQPVSRATEFSRYNPTPLAEVMIEGSTYSRQTLKVRLIKEGILEEKCSECKQGNEWQHKKLVLVLDHINGVPNDNRLENLRLLCPNCNSQTDTFTGRNRKTQEVHIIGTMSNMPDAPIVNDLNPSQPLLSYVKVFHCLECNAVIDRQTKSGLCSPCAMKKLRKAVRPSQEEMNEMLLTLSMNQIGKKYGVAAATIKEWIVHYPKEIARPPEEPMAN